MNSYFFSLTILLFIPRLFGADADRFLQRSALPSGQVAVIAEGDFEARSIGTYSVRLYQEATEWGLGDYVAGIIRPRDGTIQEVRLASICPRQTHLVVVIRCAGSGGYLSADAYSYGGHRLTLAASVAELPPDADPVAALKKVLRDRINPPKQGD